MPPKIPASVLRHIRVGPGVDVAACGERGQILFVRSRKLLTCTDCRARRVKPNAQLRARWRREQIARLAAFARERAASR